MEWVNTFALVDEIHTLKELSDGHILWDILRDVDPGYFASSLPEGRVLSDKWILKYENLKYLHKSLVAYISEECEDTLSTTHAAEGLQEIARDASAPEFSLLFKLVLQATINSPRREECILKMTSLTPDAQQSLKELIEARDKGETPDEPPNSDGIGQLSLVVDPELEFEERFGKVMIENERLLQEKKDLQSEMRNLDERLIRLQDNNTTLQQKLTAAEDYLQINGSARKSSENLSIKDLESKIKQQENDFADQETRTFKQQRTLEALQRKIDNLEASSNASAKKAQAARDEADEIKRDRDSLAKKANMVDKLSKQLQASSGLQREIDAMKPRLEEYRKKEGAFDKTRQENARLEITVAELQKLVQRVEEDNDEQSRMKKQFELDNESLRRQRKQDQLTISKLSEKARPDDSSGADQHEKTILEDEISDYDKSQSKGETMILNFEKRNAQLQAESLEKDSKIATLQRMLENDRHKGHHESQLTPASSSESSVETQSSEGFGVPNMFGAAQPAHKLDSTEAFKRLQEQLDTEANRRIKLEAQLQEKTKEVDSVKKDCEFPTNHFHEIVEQRTNSFLVALVPMEKHEMIEQAKKYAFAEMADLQTRHKLLQQTHDRTEAELAGQKQLLAQSIDQYSSLQEHPKLTQEIKDLVAAVKEGKTVDTHSAAIDAYGKTIMETKRQLAETHKVHSEKVVPLLKAQNLSFSKDLTSNLSSTRNARAAASSDRRIPFFFPPIF